MNSRYTTLRRNSQNELKSGTFAPGAGAPTLLLGEVAPGAGASHDSFPEIQSAKMASAAPVMHPVGAPALNNRPLYQSWGAEPPLNANFDTKLAFIFLRALMMESCKYNPVIPYNTPISAIITLTSTKSPFSALSLHFTKVRIFASTGLKFPFPPAKMHPTRDDYYTRQRINRPEYS